MEVNLRGILSTIKGPLGLNEKACIYSHILNFFLSTNYEKCIILEDDVIFTNAYVFYHLSAKIPLDSIVVKDGNNESKIMDV